MSTSGKRKGSAYGLSVKDHAWNASAPWPGYPDCPCGCGERGLKLQLRYDKHLVGCRCRPCIGRRNKRKGHRAQAKTHRALGGVGFTPTNEESARPYVVEVTVMPETKTGNQIPAAWDKFADSEWFRHALRQSERAVPSGSGALPAVSIRGDFVVVDIRARELFRIGAEMEKMG